MYWIMISMALAIFCLYCFKLNHYWKKKGVKRKFVFPPFGDHSFFNPIPYCEWSMKIYNRFPNERYIGCYQLTNPILMLRDPQLIKQICIKDSDHFLDHKAYFSEEHDLLWSRALLNLKGQKWKEMRATLSPSFTGSKLKIMLTLMQKCTDNVVKHFITYKNDIIEIELKDTTTRYTNDIIATTAFGIQCNSLVNRENEFFIRGKQATNFSGLWKKIKLTLAILAPSLGKMLESPMFDNEVSSFFRKIIKETVEYRRTNHIERPDMLHLLMHAKKRTPKTNESINTEEGNAIDRNHFKFNEQQADTSVGLSLEDITSQAIFFFFAGYDTVATVLCFMSYELAINPHIQQKLIEELDEFRPKNNLLTNDSLSKLTYLDMVLSETLRKWSPNVIIDRQCVKQYEIQPEHPDEKSVNLTTDDVLWIPIWALHHDPKYWNKPDEFDPERFSPRNKNKIIPYTYLPFGIGARNCIGSRFVLMEVKTFFYGLLEHFTIVPIRKSTIPVKLKKETFFVDSKDGFWFGLKKRDTRNL